MPTVYQYGNIIGVPSTSSRFWLNLPNSSSKYNVLYIPPFPPFTILGFHKIGGVPPNHPCW
jgi:hypothetical protein